MIRIRKITEADLEQYQFWKLPMHEYHNLNGPYFKKKTKNEIENEINDLKHQFNSGIENPLPQKRIIANQENSMLGEVSWSWRSEETLWMEIGIVIFSNEHWGQGIGYHALKLWITEIFETQKELVRLGLTTWSGNTGMMRLAKKLGMKKEAEYRKARIVNNIYIMILLAMEF